MEAFKCPPQKLTSRMSGKNSASNLEFVEEYYTIEENAHLFENAVIFDQISEGMKFLHNYLIKLIILITTIDNIPLDIMDEQSPYATSEGHTNSKASETISRDD